MAASTGGSPIIIDGGGSISIDLDDSHYKPGNNPDNHSAPKGSDIAALID